MLLLLTYVLLFLCAILVLRHRIKESTAHKLPPASKGGLPIIGHTISLATCKREDNWRLVKSVAEDCVLKGGVTYIIIATELYYVITDPEDFLTANNACSQKHFVYDFSKSWLGNGLITSSGEIWSRHRKLLMPAYNLHILNKFLGVFNDQSRQLVKNFAKHLDNGPFDQAGYLKISAFETICSTAFGLSSPDKDFVKNYMNAVDKMLYFVTERFEKIWLQSDLIYRLTGYKKEEDEAIKTLNSISNKVIERKKMELLLNKANTKDDNQHARVGKQPLLELLLNLNDKDALTDKEIREEVNTTIVAGFDTIAILMTLITMKLGAYPNVQEKLYEEIMQVVGLDRDVAKDDLQKLVYTEAVIKETLRMYPPGLVLMRYVDKDVKLKNYTMRAGSQCILMPYGANMYPVWGPDVNEYRPERWLDTDMVPEYAFAGFSIGKRSCIGKTFALMSMKVSLVHIMRRFRIRASDHELKLYFECMLKPVSGYEITVVNRC